MKGLVVVDLARIWKQTAMVCGSDARAGNAAATAAEYGSTCIESGVKIW